MHSPAPIGTKLPLAAARLDAQCDGISMNEVLQHLKSVDPAKRKRCRVHCILISSSRALMYLLVVDCYLFAAPVLSLVLCCVVLRYVGVLLSPTSPGLLKNPTI